MADLREVVLEMVRIEKGPVGRDVFVAELVRLRETYPQGWPSGMTERTIRIALADLLERGKIKAVDERTIEYVFAADLERRLTTDQASLLFGD